jgi:hypothetical protein
LAEAVDSGDTFTVTIVAAGELAIAGEVGEGVLSDKVGFDL